MSLLGETNQAYQIYWKIGSHTDFTFAGLIFCQPGLYQVNLGDCNKRQTILGCRKFEGSLVTEISQYECITTETDGSCQCHKRVQMGYCQHEDAMS